MPLSLLHPPADRLVAFGLGQLDFLEAVALEAHLQECARCCAHLDRLPADGLVDALRGAVRAPAAPGAAREAPQVLAPAQPSLASLDSTGLPPALESHPRYRVTALVGRGGMGTV